MQDLRLNPKSILAIKRFIGRIDFSELRPMLRGLPIGRGHDDRLNQGFPGPAKIDVALREPIEKFGMRRAFPANAKVIHRADDSFTKKIRPDVVHGNARNQGVVAIDQPSRKV